jgi:TetR/AcrR family transcriptional regulator
VSDEKRELILVAAVGCFGRYGFRRTSMDMLARAAGMSRPALYQHFNGKEDLFRAMIGRMLDVAIQDAEAASQRAGGTVRDRLHGVLAAKLQLIVGHTGAEFRGELLAEAAALAGDLVALFQGRLLAILEGLLRSATDEVDLVGVALTAEDAAVLLLDAVTGIEQAQATPELLHRRLHQLVDVAVRGLATAHTAS